MRYFGQKFVQLLIVVIAVTFTVSLALGAVPNSKERIVAAKGGGAITEADRTALLDSLHLNDSAVKQYGYFVKDLVTVDWGTTFGGNQSIRTSIWDGLKVSLRLMIYAQVVALLIAIPVAIAAAYRQGGFFDRASTTVSFGFLATPNYILAPVLVLFLSITWKLLPSQSKDVSFFDSPWEHFKNFFMPTIVLALPLAATYMRLLRADLVNTLQSDFITTARAKGLSTNRILFGHALRPSMFSLLTAAAVNVGALVGGLERLAAPDGPFANWSRAIDAWCAAALWPGAAPGPAVVQEWIASLLGRPTTLPSDQVRRWLTQAAEVAASACRLSLGAGVSRGVLRCPRPAARRRRLRRGAGQSALGHAARRYRLGGRARRGARTRGAVAPLLPRVWHLHAPGPRARQPLPAVSRARAAAHAARRPLRADSAVGHRHRSRQRGAAAAAVRSVRHRHLARLRQPGRDLPDSSQRALRPGGGDDWRPHRGVAVSIGPSGCARARPLPQRSAAGRRPRRCSASRGRGWRHGTPNISACRNCRRPWRWPS